MAAETAFLTISGSTLPEDVLPVRYEAVEAISRPYEVSIEISTNDPLFDVATCLRQRVLLTLVDGTAGMRSFDGIVDRAEFAYVTGTRIHFVLRLRPRLAALAHREGCRIFQTMSVPDVVKKVLADAGVDEGVEWQLTADYEPREFVVQYRESDLAFVHRLLEDEGIFYFFRHSPEGHTMILADANEAFAPVDDALPVAFSLAQGASGVPLHGVTRTRSLRTTSVHLRDYDFKKPKALPEAALPAKDAWPAPYYEYPSGALASAVATRKANARARERRRDADLVHGKSRAVGLGVGVPFTIDGAAEECLNGDFVVVELRTRGEQALEASASSSVCDNAFTAIPAKAPFGPARATPRPVIRGVQTATVTGPGGEEIHVDKLGRIKVRFHWDREGQFDDKASCWLRVSQLMMGGSMALPRVGWEVAVAFHDGDPDRPFVLGRVYNAEKTPPYALPGSKASGAIKSASSPGGAGYNELNFGDSGGSQGLTIHAQKDLNITVNHDKTETVSVDETHDVKVNMSISVGSKESIEIGANQTVNVGAVCSHNIGGSDSITVGGNETDDATANYVEHIGGGRTSTTGGNHVVISNTVMSTVTGNITRNVGAAQLTASIKSIADEVGGAITENVGAVRVELVKGTSSESVGGTKSLTSAAAELHLVKGNVETSAEGGVTNLVGGLHYQKIAGDYSVKAPTILLVGAVGQLKGGDSSLKLGGAPIVLTGSKVAIETALLVKLGASLKMGS